jgi:3'(2'), 5'-bisphosphate nucleotidase
MSELAPAADTGLLNELTALASRAAAAILAVSRDRLAVRSKSDQSPVTAADEASDATIASGLAQLLPGIVIVSEESPRTVNPGPSFVLVDPLDGTREFLAGRDEYTINIAIIVDHRPLVGVIAAPALGLVYRGIVGRGAERLRLTPGAGLAQASEVVAIRTRTAPAGGLVAAVSRSHLEPATEAFLQGVDVHDRISSGSALKFCRIAEGTADLYPRLSPTSEWDVGAGHAIVAAAGGIVTAPDRTPLKYGGASGDFRVPAFIAWGDPTAAGSRESRVGWPGVTG